MIGRLKRISESNNLKQADLSGIKESATPRLSDLSSSKSGSLNSSDEVSETSQGDPRQLTGKFQGITSRSNLNDDLAIIV